MTLEPRLCVKTADNSDKSFHFFGKSIQKHPDSVCENGVNNEQNVPGIICQTIKREDEYSIAKKNIIVASIFW